MEGDGKADRLTADAYLARHLGAPAGRYELEDGRVVETAPETLRHNRVKALVWGALADAIATEGGDATALTDGMAVRIDDGAVREPDASVIRGMQADLDVVEAPDVLLAVEVVSPPGRSGDPTRKLVEYMSVPSIAHHLVVDPDRRTVVHHARDAQVEGGIRTTIRGADDTLALDPPGIAVPVASFIDRR